MTEFPEFLLPPSDRDASLSEYRALAEWYFHNLTEPETRVVLRELADERRQHLAENDVDLASVDHDIMWWGWHNAIKSVLNFCMHDCEHDAHHLMLHVNRSFQWSAMIMLLTLEPDVPEPPAESEGTPSDG